MLGTPRWRVRPLRLVPYYRQRKIIFELVWHFVADTDTDKNDFGIVFS